MSRHAVSLREVKEAVKGAREKAPGWNGMWESAEDGMFVTLLDHENVDLPGKFGL